MVAPEYPREYCIISKISYCWENPSFTEESPLVCHILVGDPKAGARDSPAHVGHGHTVARHTQRAPAVEREGPAYNAVNYTESACEVLDNKNTLHIYKALHNKETLLVYSNVSYYVELYNIKQIAGRGGRRARTQRMLARMWRPSRWRGRGCV